MQGENMNKVVVITGGTSGIGKELVNLYKKNGTFLYYHPHQSQQQKQKR